MIAAILLFPHTNGARFSSDIDGAARAASRSAFSSINDVRASVEGFM
jgi:hypothetical protein